jgi:tripartite-type tricarboxylate transporter receptor subunit TctC
MPEVPASVPLVKDHVASEEDKKVLDVIFMSTILARPYIAPPDIPADRVKALRDAFMATMKDPEFLAEVKRIHLTIDPISGEEMEKLVREAYALPPSIIEKVRRTLAD